MIDIGSSPVKSKLIVNSSNNAPIYHYVLNWPYCDAVKTLWQSVLWFD